MFTSQPTNRVTRSQKPISSSQPPPKTTTPTVKKGSNTLSLVKTTPKSVDKSRETNLADASHDRPKSREETPKDKQNEDNRASSETTNPISNVDNREENNPPQGDTDGGNDGRIADNANPNTDPVTESAIPALSNEEIEKLLWEYKRDSTKLTKSTHHLQFLSECHKERKIPKGLQLRMNLNVMDGDKELKGRIQGILFTAELEILTELIAHYEDLTRKLQGDIDKTKASLDHFKDTNQTIKETFADSKRELNLLEDKLTNRRYNKKRTLTNFEDRITHIAEERPLNDRERDRQRQTTWNDEHVPIRQRDEASWNHNHGPIYQRDQARLNHEYGPMYQQNQTYRNYDRRSPGPENNPSTIPPLMRRLTPPRLRQPPAWRPPVVHQRHPDMEYYYRNQTQSNNTVGNQLGDFAKNLNLLINQFQSLSTLLLQPSYH